MSSEGSVSSRISQFGLYRTIDARTEEFLKLSKRRQIKQGCVCAAISTALTVTVVVVILLIYEYNIITEARRTSNTNNWLNLINNSADDSTLLEMFNKEKFNIDRTTLKLLPILIKALNQNGHIKKLKEDHSELYTPYEVTTEISVTENLVSDTRNWMKMPYSKTYNMEYKTSPIAFIKTTNRNLDYYTKIRKIRDYQRILNYVDKMISEKNSLGATQSMTKHFDRTGKPIKMTTPIPKRRSTEKAIKLQKSNPRTITDKKKNNCKCSHKFGELMAKLLTSIEQLLSYISGSISKEKVHECNSTIPAKPIKSLTENAASTIKTITELPIIYEPEIIKTTFPYKKILDRHRYTIDYDPNNIIDTRRDYTASKLMKLIKPNRLSNFEINFASEEDFGTTKSYDLSKNNDIELTEALKSYPTYVASTNTKPSTNIITTVEDNTLRRGNYDTPDTPGIRALTSTFSEPDFTYNDDYIEVTKTTENLANNYEKVDNARSLESVKNNIAPVKKDENKEHKYYPTKGGSNRKKSFNNVDSLRKAGKLISSKNNKIKFSSMLHRFAPVSVYSRTSRLRKTKNESNSNNSTTTVLPVEKITKPNKDITIYHITTTKPVENKLMIPKQNLSYYGHNIKLNFNDTEFQEVFNKNIANETTLNQIEEAIKILNNESATSYVENITAVLDDTYQWDFDKLEENTTSTQSMIPLRRSTYLEIQRHDWKQDEPQDDAFDVETNNYIFD